MRRRRGVRGEEVGVKKFNMTLKKKSQFGSMQQLRAKDGGQAGPLRGQSWKEGRVCTLCLWQLCSEHGPSFSGRFVFL